MMYWIKNKKYKLVGNFNENINNSSFVVRWHVAARKNNLAGKNGCTQLSQLWRNVC